MLGFKSLGYSSRTHKATPPDLPCATATASSTCRTSCGCWRAGSDREPGYCMTFAGHTPEVPAGPSLRAVPWEREARHSAPARQAVRVSGRASRWPIRPYVEARTAAHTDGSAAGRRTSCNIRASDGAPHSGTIAGPATATKQGPAVLRRLLVQIAWGMKRRSARVSALFERLTHGQRTRRKKAIVAVARKILI